MVVLGVFIMKVVQIESSKLPDIDYEAKKFINQGYWTLVKIKRDPKEIADYMLDMDGNYALLSRSGSPVRIESVRPIDIIYDEIVYFSDIARPESLCNYVKQ